MRYQVDYDTDSDGDTVDLDPAAVPLLGTPPERVDDGHLAVYDFPAGTPEEDIFEALEEADWSFRSAGPAAEAPEP